MYPAKKPLRFVKNVVFLRAVTSEILHENSHFALFLVKKYLKKHDVPCKKTVTFCENRRFFAGGNFWNTAWNLTFCPIFCQKATKKTKCTLQKNRYVFWKLSFFCWWFFLTFLLKSHLYALFLVKKQVKNHAVPCIKTVTFCENRRFFPVCFSWNSVWNLTFCPFFWSKHN